MPSRAGDTFWMAIPSGRLVQLEAESVRAEIPRRGNAQLHPGRSAGGDLHRRFAQELMAGPGTRRVQTATFSSLAGTRCR